MFRARDPVPDPLQRRPLALALAAALLVGGCGGPRVQLASAGGVAGFSAVIGPPTRIDTGPMPTSPQAWAELGAGHIAVLTGAGWRVPPLRLSDDQQAGLRGFVERGGRLLLFGHAAAVVAAIGLEPQAPEVQPFRWGFDDRTALGRAQLGFRSVSGKLPELLTGLTAAPGREHAFFLTGGEPCCVPLCTWQIGEPSQGVVLGRLLVERDGRSDAGGAPVLVHWTFGKGQVLACGLQPVWEGGDATHRHNGSVLMQRAVAWAGGGSMPGQVSLWQLPAAPEPPPPAAQLPFGQRELPVAPLLGHWGWQAPAAWLHDAEPRTPEDVLLQVLLPSWRAGADLLELDLGGRDHGLPLAWSARDPMKRPTEWLGEALWPAWTPGTIGQLAAEATARGMLLQMNLDALPLSEVTPVVRAAAVRWLARELADQRRLGARAVTGFSLRRWFADDQGLTAALVQDLNPGAFLVAAGERVHGLGGAVAATDADDGAPSGLPVAGLSAQWRDGFPADLWPAGVLDARPVRTAASQHGGEVGGGSSGDWIATQAADFVRQRLGRGGAIWWRAHAAATLAPDTIDYVHGVSLEPLRAAVAATCAAIGKGGWREAQRAQLPDVQKGFGAEVPVAAAAPLLQNNWFRLLGSGGNWLWDPQGLGRFGPGQPTVLARELFRTRLFGGRPSADELRADQADWLRHGVRGEGGFGEEVRVGGGDPAQRKPPQVLAFDERPAWPRRAVFDLDFSTGYYELDLQPRGIRGAGVVTVRLDDAVVACVPFSEAAATSTVVPVHLARRGARKLILEVASGGAVAIDVLRLVRRGDVAAEAAVATAAGSMAALQESSASTYHAERAELRTLADLPGFLWRAECLAAVRNLQLERQFGLLLHTELAATSGGDTARSLRSPFVLKSAQPGVPELAVVPLTLARYEHFELRDGRLSLKAQPEPGASCAVGFLLLQPAERAAFDRLSAVFQALERPLPLDLGRQGLASLTSDLPFAWTRVLQVAAAQATPFLVRENGWWQWRGSQALPDGSDLLRVVQLPGDAVEIVGGAAVLARTRPGPGSQRLVALREPSPDAVTVRVLQRSPLVPPSVTMAQDFAECTIDGEPWAWFHDRTVVLPDRVGTFAVRTTRHDGKVSPHLVSTCARIERCRWDAVARELVLLAAGDDARPADLPYNAVIAGPEPLEVIGGERVPEAELRHVDAAARAAALAGGVVIRFRPGLIQVRYGD
ncbi:MAG: hypothetical protein IPK26_24275 [Planctomycetes bacterium]|nr:hypothetical protein [Planctomycetota bacterium]